MILDLSYLDYQQDVFFNWPPGIRYKAIPKGRRSGITKGGSNAVIETLVDKQGPILWGDTINANIDKYFQRYIEPELRANNINYRWQSQAKQLTIGNQYCDFRSADNPENWEGFGYNLIFLNEAGIILKDRQLYSNTVLPMMLDYKKSKLIAAGVPKGKFCKDGKEHPFFTLYKRALEHPDRYMARTITSYQNPLLDAKSIQELEDEIASLSPEAIRQEIYGEFIDVDALNPFAFQFDPAHHLGSVHHNPNKQLYISIDFNLNPFAVTFWHFWQDTNGFHLHGIDEAEIENGSIPAMIDLIRSRYGSSLPMALMTGDAMGNQRNIALVNNASHYMELCKGLHMGENQLRVGANPTHENSRTEVNNLLHHAKHNPRYEFKINPDKCPNLVRDCKTVQCDAFGQIVKKNRHDLAQRADHIDCMRYMINLVYRNMFRGR